MRAESSYAVAEQRVRLLQRHPQAFGHPVEGAVECIETHISWVLLAGGFAYKFKKPLRLDVLDFSTVAQRRAACEDELRINRRTAPALYLGLVALVPDAADGPRLLPLGDAPFHAEPAVQMRRFAQDALLVHALERQELLPEHIDSLARHVARFHADAAVAAPAQGWGTAQAVRSAVDECVDALRPLLHPAPPLAALLEPVAAWCLREGEALAPVFQQRLADGHVRECHGDLHLANIALIEGQPQLFDAIEFNPALRWIDCVADIAFVVMDLAAHGRADLGWRFANLWLEQSGDYAGLSVLRYYLVYRAVVRAWVAGARMAQACGDSALALEVQTYLELAARVISSTSQPPTLWLAHGFSGAGKSTHALALACARGMVRVRADVERKRLFGLTPEAGSGGVPGGIYTAEATRRTYDRLIQVADDALAAGFSAVVDATFLDPAARSRFITLAQQRGVPGRVLSFEAPLEVLRERVIQRAALGLDASEAGLAVLESQWATALPLAPWEEALAVHVDTTRPVDWNALLPLTSDGRE
ncbi:bifunctional aminoglycoside phosphotransferase/ATP-binding protein [Ottowia caeni]|uniref:bifunctional aminoglycoside phosphotransferase/ATP-binding protein n=1 Tax=Ottowia caeni TaxID=2870339 RepID=UPI001E5FC751|nr:AAA family ATPase [Ottowia caeni]